MGVSQDWRQVERWLSANAPAVLERLPMGASKPDVLKAEASMGVTLPASLRESLIAHDGADLYIYDGKRGAPLGRPMSLRAILAQYRMLVNLFGDGHNDDAAHPPPGVRACWWCDKWVPALAHVNGDATCVDLGPAPGGILGQVFDWAHDNGPGVVYARDYAEVLAGFASDLEAGRYTVTLSGRGEPYLDWIG
jgi:cell wall assembly regulator SMI1